MVGVAHALEIVSHSTDEHLCIVGTGFIAGDVGEVVGCDREKQMGPQGVEGDRLEDVQGRDDVP